MKPSSWYSPSLEAPTQIPPSPSNKIFSFLACFFLQVLGKGEADVSAEPPKKCRSLKKISQAGTQSWRLNFARSSNKCPFLALPSQRVTPWALTLTLCSYFGSPERNVPVWSSEKNSPISSARAPVHSPAKEAMVRLCPLLSTTAPSVLPGPCPNTLDSPQQRRAMSTMSMAIP